jgi:cytochrome c biogenesis protein
MPKDFRSWLTIIENGKEMLRKEITVNDPLRYNGITFYQSSYGFQPSNRSRFRIAVTTPDNKTQPFELRFEESFTVPGTTITGTIVDFSPALGIDKGRIFTYAESMNNPAVLIQFKDKGKVLENHWSLRRYPETWRTKFGVVVEFKDLWASQYTGLQVRKDPGVWIVYLGCLVMAIGLYMAFFMSHSRIWIGLGAEKNTTRVMVAASINKHKIGLERKLDLLVQELSGRSDRAKR